MALIPIVIVKGYEFEDIDGQATLSVTYTAVFRKVGGGRIIIDGGDTLIPNAVDVPIDDNDSMTSLRAKIVAAIHTLVNEHQHILDGPVEDKDILVPHYVNKV